MSKKIQQLKQKAIEEFDKNCISSQNMLVCNLKAFLGFHQDELEKAVREEIIEEIKKIRDTNPAWISLDKIAEWIDKNAVRILVVILLLALLSIILKAINH